MPYVPGYSNDIFLSYAHGDDPVWMQAFEQALARTVRSRLGPEITVWQDIKRLRAGNDWDKAIADGIAASAVFVAVLSPTYQYSPYCSQELTTFLGPEGLLDKIKVGDLHRFLKVIKIPWENNDHELFFEKLQHVVFFRKVDGPQEFIEFPANSDSFMSCVQDAAASVAMLLRTMRRTLQMVFVASPATDVADAWNRVRKQLRDDRYDVRPDGMLNPGYDDKVILRDMENAVLTVHLLGPSYDAFAERQLKLAADAGRRQLVWFAKGTEQQDQVDPKQWKLFDSIRKKEGLSPGLEWFPGTVQEMIGQIQGSLKPKATAPALEEAAAPRIYLLHDPTTSQDAAFAMQLQSDLRDKEKVEVIFPPTGLASAMDYNDRHRQLLHNCEGVLLYWNSAPETWFDQYYRDVLVPSRKAKARSRAFLLDDPTQIDQESVPVIRRSAQFSLSDLEPFLKPLRGDGVKRAGV